MAQRQQIKSVLVIEDDFVLKVCLAEVSQAEGYGVRVARDGQHGLDLFWGPPLPDPIALDVMMPIKDGAAFRLEQCKDPRPKTIPTVVMSADVLLRDHTQLFVECAHTTKPLNTHWLLRAVERRCG